MLNREQLYKDERKLLLDRIADLEKEVDSLQLGKAAEIIQKESQAIMFQTELKQFQRQVNLMEFNYEQLRNDFIENKKVVQI